MSWIKNTWVGELIMSFSNEKGGLSGRKLSAFAGVSTACYIGIYTLPESDRLYGIYAFLMFALLCLGLVTIPELIKVLSFKKGGGTIIETTKTEKTEEKTEVKTE